MGTHVNKLLCALAVSGLLATSLATKAADLPAQAGPPSGYVPPVFNWTGFYVGGNVGAAWAQESWTDTLFGLTLNTGGNNGLFIGGGEVGFNYRIGAFVIGAEGDFDWAAHRSNNSTGFIPTVGNVQVTSNDTWISTLAVRFGYAMDRWLIYGKAGGGWIGHSGFTVTNLATSLSMSGSNSNTAGGWLVGAGSEWAITPNWTVKFEYDYLGLGNQSVTLPGTVISALAGDTFTTDKSNVQMVKLGVNYLFNWDSPVVAKY